MSKPDSPKVSPDLKRPASALRKNLIFFGSIAAVIVPLVTVAYIYKNSDQKDSKISDEIFKQRGIDSDFFAVPEDEKEFLEQVEEDKRKEEEKRYAFAKSKKSKKKKSSVSKPKRKAPKPKRKLTARELFTVEQTQKRVDESRIKRIAFNNSRRGSSGVRVVENYEGLTTVQTKQRQRAESLNVQKDWSEPKIEASYPVKLERVITVDKYIPAILLNEVNSELGGKVVAQIEENIYGKHGRKVLIPAGSKAIGYYKPLAKVGMERLQILWPRIITPEGINIHTGDADMADAMGRSGVTGDVQRRYGERYGMALLVSLLSAAAQYQIPLDNANQAIIVQNTGREIGGISRAILDEHIQIKPIVSIPAGSRILITASKDIWFKEPQGEDIEVEVYKK